MTRIGGWLGSLLAVAIITALASPALAQNAEFEDDDGFIPTSPRREPQPPRHDLVETNRLCELMGSGWTMTNPSPGRFFCGLRYLSTIVTVVALTNRTIVYTVASEEENDRIRGVWLIMDTMSARMLGPLARNVTLMFDSATDAYVVMTVEDRQTIIVITPPDSAPYAGVRDLATRLGATPERTGPI